MNDFFSASHLCTKAYHFERLFFLLFEERIIDTTEKKDDESVKTDDVTKEDKPVDPGSFS